MRNLPLTAEPSGAGIAFRANVPLADVVGTGTVRLRLRLTWQNSSWETEIARPPGGEDEVSFAFGPDGVLALSRPAA